MLAAVDLVEAQQRGLDNIEHDLIQACSYRRSIISPIRYRLSAKQKNRAESYAVRTSHRSRVDENSKHVQENQ